MQSSASRSSKPLAFQATSDALSNGVRQLGKLSARRRLHSAKPRARSIRAIDVDTIENNHVGSSSGILSFQSVITNPSSHRYHSKWVPIFGNDSLAPVIQ